MVTVVMMGRTSLDGWGEKIVNENAQDDVDVRSEA